MSDIIQKARLARTLAVARVTSKKTGEDRVIDFVPRRPTLEIENIPVFRSSRVVRNVARPTVVVA